MVEDFKNIRLKSKQGDIIEFNEKFSQLSQYVARAPNPHDIIVVELLESSALMFLKVIYTK